MGYDAFRGPLSQGDALLVVPPFGGVDRPSLAAHLLQACASRAGFRTPVLYANMALARLMGDMEYEAVCFAETSALLGERFFASWAYGLPPFGRDDPRIEASITDLSGKFSLSADSLRQFERGIGDWVSRLAATIVAAGYRVVGCSSTFEQTAASVAILNAVKAAAPDTITILGGANCEGEMAEGILTLGARIDYVFSGESEQTFPQFLRDIAAGNFPRDRIISGAPCRDLDSLPLPDFSEYFQQRDALMPESPFATGDQLWLPYEGSRGCWWGQKHHCTFCGINGEGMQFRQRSADRVIADLRALLERHGVRRICMTDNIMPHTFFRTLVPRLGQEVAGLHIFYEQKANLRLEQVVALKNAGVAVIQPGIEALSTDLLRLMDKGVTARQNIALLRYARSVGLDVSWNLLYAFPGDREEWYRETLAMIPYLRHLAPPSGPCHLSIDRFSPYFFASSRYGVEKVRPMDSYFSVLPDGADVKKVAYHFLATYESGSRVNAPLVQALEEALEAWRKAWEAASEDTDSNAPTLGVVQISGDEYILVDYRGIEGQRAVQFLDRDQAGAVLVQSPLSADTPSTEWARANHMALALDGWHVPLATAAPKVLAGFEESRRWRPPLPTGTAKVDAGLVQIGSD
jgi:ribosomal peptide maturation radical SAM protein 1